MIFLAVRNLNINGLPYIMPIHPNLVHFTIGLFGIAIAFDIIGAFYRQEQAIMRWLHIEYFSGEMDEWQVLPRFEELLRGIGVIFVQDTVQSIDLHKRQVQLAVLRN